MAMRMNGQYGGSMPDLHGHRQQGYAETVYSNSPQSFNHHNNQDSYNQQGHSSGNGPYAAGARANDTQYFDDNPYSSAYAPHERPQQQQSAPPPQYQVPYENPYAPGAHHSNDPYSQQVHAGYASPPFDHAPGGTGYPPTA
ncbi:hypothetical protein LTR66_016247, partial [Elasticomyces elasticus]